MKFETACAVLLYLTTANAAPTTSLTNLEYVKISNGRSVPFYYPSNVRFITSVPKSSFAPVSDEETLRLGKEYLVRNLGLTIENLYISSIQKSADQVTHLYVSHKINGVEVTNHNAAVHLLNGQVIAFSSSFGNEGNSFAALEFASTEVKVSLEEAVQIAESDYGIKQDSFPAYNAYVEIPANKVVFAHVFQLRDDKTSQWLQVSVDATTGQIVHVVDYVNEATYKVVQLPKIIALDGFEVATNPEDSKASPNGWSSGTSTTGNNVDSRIGSLRIDGGSSKNFDTNWDATQDPTTDANKRAAIVNNFYVSNTVHDIAYQYGFDEVSGNFQEDNFGKGGKGGDSVTINNQASGTNNANFATPPDGQKPTMNMFLWTFTTPKRDGSLDNGVPIHEYTHGISNRLTGGPSNVNCLNSLQAGGMGEGWSDTLAIYFTMKETDTRKTNYALGSYVYNNPKGIREFVYSTDQTVNPLTYYSLYSQDEVHSVGTTWATMLYELYWALRDQYGYSPNLFDATQLKGNIMAIQLVIGAMKIQPCNPTFMAARDAIISADSTYYGGQNKCLIWKTFAKRGLGVNADPKTFKNGFNVPYECGGPMTTTTSPVPEPTFIPCIHSVCEVGEPLDPECDVCAKLVIERDPPCGSNYWDGICVREVNEVCGYICDQ